MRWATVAGAIDNGIGAEMSMTALERLALLSQWIKPSSTSEQQRQDRAVRMIQAAVDGHAAFADTDVCVYAKGSYANNTNVRLDSDVDVVVENRDLFYYECTGHDTHVNNPAVSPYTGLWTPASWRAEVATAMVNAFGSRDVDCTGSIAIAIAEKPGSRPNADVVPSFPFHMYWDPAHSSVTQGSRVFSTTGNVINNWPEQQLANGRAKNIATGQRYKNFVRILKNSENYLVDAGAITAKPSYFMECLIWNVPNHVMTGGTLDNDFRDTLQWLYDHLTDAYVYADWDEPNAMHYLFWQGQKWTLDDAREVVAETWNLLDY